MRREDLLARLGRRDGPWDLAVVGGGATGVGIAIDAASRGYDVVLLEQSDFGKGTSSRSTKLVHGGVRYLQQGNIPLVMEALKERGILRRNAPHLVTDLPFVASRNLSREETIERIPTIETGGLRGGVMYHDGQFDDARLLIHMVMTAHEQGAVCINYLRVNGLIKDGSPFI